MFDIDKKDLLLALPFIALLIIWTIDPSLFGLIEQPERRPATPVDSSIVMPADSGFAATPSPGMVPTGNKPLTLDVADSSLLAARLAGDSVIPETTIIVTNKYVLTLSSRGGGPVSIKLPEFSYKNGEQIELLKDATAALPELSINRGAYLTSGLHYQSDHQWRSYEVTSDPVEITYRTMSEAIGGITKTYRFYPDTYHFDLIVTVANPEKMGVGGSYRLEWNTPPGVTEPNPTTDYEAMEVVVMMGGSRDKLDDFNDGKLKQALDGVTTWVGVRSKYFTGAIIPRSRAADGAVAQGVEREISTPDGKIQERKLTGGVEMGFPSMAAFTDSFTVYAGPLDYALMADYDVGLEDMLDIGTFPVLGALIKPFAIGIMWLLPKMYDFVPNYGLVIILFALAVKLITLPLSMKSFKSMNAMKELQPKVEALKAKHKKNPQALNKEMMQLYKAHGVNPISGCLPMLPQMPLFFALFRVFQSTILLRQAPFVWFFDDLSVGASGLTDPYMVLVVLMVGTQFISQKLTMASTQQNKALMYMMPLFMGFIFRSFPAGLVLYWTCFSAFSLIDYFVFKRNKNAQVKAT